MRFLKSLALVAAVTIAPVLAQNSSSSGTFDAQCDAFADELRATYENATIWFTESVAAGTNLSLPDYDPTCGNLYQVVDADICRVAMFMSTSESSNISGMLMALLSPFSHYAVVS